MTTTGLIITSFAHWIGYAVLVSGAIYAIYVSQKD